MKNRLSENSKVMMTAMSFIVLCMLSIQFGYAQDLSDFADGAEDNADILTGIFRTILRVALGAGVIGVVWAYIFNNQKAKDNLIYFIIAIIIGGIGELWL